MRQIQLQRFPVIAVVEGNPHAGSSSGKEQALPDGDFAHGVDRSVIRETVSDQLPGLASIVRMVDIRMKVVDAEAAEGSEGGLLVEMRGCLLRHFAPRNQLRCSD